MKKNLATKKHLEKGFSLIEIMISVAILTLILSLVGLFQTDVFSMNNLIGSGLNDQYNNKQFVKAFVFELRNATTSPAGDYPLVQAGTSTLVFYSNIDNDNDIEKVSYYLDGAIFKKVAIKPTGENIYSDDNKILIKEIQNVQPEDVFAFYASSTDGTFAQSSMSEPINLQDVRLIKMKLQTSSTIETRVAPRNLKNNF
jgi:prepilin-type N-terminal cleavage/methylation domain-containing protein